MTLLKKYGWLVLLAIWVVLLVWKGVVPGWQDGRSDFSNYYASSKLLLAGEEVGSFYDNEAFFQRAQDMGVKEGAKFAPFTPFTAYCFLPLASFSEQTARRIWLIVNVLLLVLLGGLLARGIGLTRNQLLVVGFVFLTPLMANIRLGQIYLFITVGLLAAILYLAPRKNGPFEFVLAAFAALKIFPAFYLMFRRSEKNMVNGLLWFFGSLVGLTLILIAAHGVSSVAEYMAVFISHMNGSLSGQEIHSFNYQSIDSLLHFLFVSDAMFNLAPLMDMPVLKSVFKWAYVVFVLFFVIRIFAMKERDPLFFNESVVLVGLALIFPATATYHFLLFLVPLSYVLVATWNKAETTTCLAIVGLSLLAMNVLPHHIPHMVEYPNLNALMHYPRLFGLIGLFSVLCFRALHRKTT